MVTTINLWMYGALIGSFALGLLIGMALGRRKAVTEMLYQQQRMEATKVWTEALGKVMGGHHVKHN